MTNKTSPSTEFTVRHTSNFQDHQGGMIKYAHSHTHRHTKTALRDFSGSPVVGASPFRAGGMGLILAQEAKKDPICMLPKNEDMEHGNKNKNKQMGPN